MADAPIVHIGENSPENIALKLFDRVEIAEGHPNRAKEGILDLYAECLLAVKNPAGRLGGRHDKYSQN
jgi:hypothetical protein